MDTIEQKRQALLTVARAFYDRGDYIQYDMRSMDRMLQLTPRRRKHLPPEASSSQYVHFLDCSGFVSAAYLTAFGYELPSDLTWLMIDQLEPRVFYYEFTHEESPAEILAIGDKLRDILQPGDLITFDKGVGGGHVVMYLGGDRYTDCTCIKTGYDYEACKNRMQQPGIWCWDLDVLLPVEEEKFNAGRSLYRKAIRRFAVHRPLEIVGDILPQAKIRMEQAKDLWCAVENSAPGCQQAYPGKTVDYTVVVRNLGQDERPVTVTFAPPAGAAFSGENTVRQTLKAGEEIRLQFTVTVDKDNAQIQLDGPAVIVNDLMVYAHPVLLGRPMEPAAWRSVKETALGEIQAGATALAAAAKAYAPFDITLEPKEKPYSWTYFCYHDSTAGEALSRRPQKPFEDLAVYSAFGGKGVITPEMTAVQGVRLTYITKADLLPGDVLLCLEDGFGDTAYSAFFDGENLVGRFEAEGQTRTVRDEELDRFIDSLFGRFAFLLLRPWQGKK